MKLLVGLGNPGEKYKNNRHNAGYLVVDKLGMKLPKGVVAVKTGTFMNESGPAIKKLLEKFSVEPNNLYVIHDDLDIRLGDYKIQFDKGPKVHNGISSVESAVGTDFWRVRVGVDNRDPENRTPGEEYVLQDFTAAEIETLNPVIERVVNDLCQRVSQK